MAIGSPIAYSPKHNWVDICTDPLTADNGGSTVVDPGAIARAAQHWLQLPQHGNSVEVRLKYPTAGNITTPCHCAMFGRDQNGVPKEFGAVGISPTAGLDVSNGTYSYTDSMTRRDTRGCKEILVAVVTALAGTGLTGATIQARVV